MASEDEVASALVGLAAGALFSGAYLPGDYAASTLGLTVKAYVGWPESNNIDADMALGRAHVSVYAEPNATRDVTRHELKWRIATPGVPTLVAVAVGNVCAFSGQGGAGQVVEVSVGTTAEAQSVAYRLVSNDTPATVAGALAALLLGSRPVVVAAANGPVLTISTTETVAVQVGADSIAVLETQRVEQMFRVSCWCPSPASRGTVSNAVSVALAGAGLLPDGTGRVGWFLAADGISWCRISFVSSYTDDKTGKDLLWLRHFRYRVEYPTGPTQSQPAMLAGSLGLRTNGFPLPARLAIAVAAPTLGAIRWDAWYDPTWAVTQAVEADLSPAQFEYRLPFFASVTAGVATVPAGSQTKMDAEIAAAVTARLDYWAFLAWPPGSSGGIALALYLSSAHRSAVNFCMIEQFQNIFDVAGGGYQPELAATLALVTQAGYQTVPGGRPLMYFLASDEPTLAAKFGSRDELSRVMAYVRASIQASVGKDPYLVVMDPDPMRAAGLVPFGFDAAGAYSTPGEIVATSAYSALVASTEAWWSRAAAQGVQVVPPVMAGWNDTPRIVTPSVWFGSEVFGLPSAFYQDGTANAIAAHAGDALAWVVANPTAAPAQTALVYAWNEFDEGGYICPTWLTGNPAGDSSRVTALGAR